MNQDARARAFKVIIVGPQAVGKSSILFRLSESRFDAAYLSTVGIDFKTYTTRVQDKSYSLQIWDTAGQEKFRALTSTYYKGSQACVCVFDLTDPSSLQRCDFYLSKALEENIPRDCIYLVGNKSDLSQNESEIGAKVANKYGVDYETCSAKEGVRVSQIFDALAVKLVRHFGEGQPQKSEELKPRINIHEGNKKCCG